ncbi:TIR domain-containing protein [Salinicola sp. JS01]|uniref:TIR domain-containing protein n=1 Tax=Salinicola sp. JS01 TaxID=3050071 RepID=UPI00255BE38C|nr:TIR domain-containing protein [Salinicola sp. JS01]WIX32778.1 TIR domain-containing protein [Salinicola sp. JS01]
MPYLHNYRLFVSHAWRYSERYDRAIKFLNSAPNFSWTNYSVPVDKKFGHMSVHALEEELRQQIRPTQCVVVLAGMYVAHSDWIQFEIDFAKSLGKPILGIIPWGADRTPISVSLAANKMVGWNANAIVSGIREITP